MFSKVEVKFLAWQNVQETPSAVGEKSWKGEKEKWKVVSSYLFISIIHQESCT